MVLEEKFVCTYKHQNNSIAGLYGLSLEIRWFHSHS
jgi:hypothetical protein